jgi:hypothetical protein
MDFPSGEVVWALQGFPRPREPIVLAALGDEFNYDHLEQELVIGHSEYRRAAHRAIHFRRCFSELFRTHSLLFLGSGLAEPYFLTLFDEIVELSGPPARPHFALIQEGDLNPDFMQRQYHVLCTTYPCEEHGRVADLLREFTDYVLRDRARPSTWAFRMASPNILATGHSPEHFKVIRGRLPSPRDIPENEAVAISCGRGDPPSGSLGWPVPSYTGARILGLTEPTHTWHGNWVVKWEGLKGAYGIVARELSNASGSSRDRRSPEAIRVAFRDFLRVVDSQKCKRAHVQILSAGESRAFQPWISLAQMARAYGRWSRERSPADANDFLQVIVYIVDPGVIALLQGGYLNLLQELQDGPVNVNVETIDSTGNAERHHCLVPSNAKLDAFVKSPLIGPEPVVYALPMSKHRFEPLPLREVATRQIGELGLVSGSTLVVDYRASAAPRTPTASRATE